MHEISDFIDLAAQFGVDHVQYMDLMNINSAFAGISATDYGDEVKALFDTAVSRASSLGISVGSFIPYSSSSSLAMKRYAVDEASSTGSETAGYAPCYEPWRNILVCSDGTATLCCRSGVVTGNLLKDGLEGVWNSDTYQFYRKRVNSPTPPEACRSCPVKMGMSS
jgi:MoaA/NifB/PqqE/SkfB family radical SAM enzyme